MYGSPQTQTDTGLTASFLGNLRKPAPERQKPIWLIMKQDTMIRWGMALAVRVASGPYRPICKSFALRSRQITTPAPRHSFLPDECSS